MACKSESERRGGSMQGDRMVGRFVNPFYKRLVCLY